MFTRVPLLALVSMLILALAGCGGGQENQQQAGQPAEPPPPPKPAEQVPIYEITKDDITTHPDWTSRNISVLGVKLGDRTREVEKNLGELTNTRTGAEDYITAYKDGGIVIYTFKLTGKARKIEVTQFLKGIRDEKVARLLSSGSLAAMREVLGQEEDTVQNEEESSTEYSYDSRGIRFVKYKVQGRTINAIRFTELRRSTT